MERQQPIHRRRIKKEDEKWQKMDCVFLNKLVKRWREEWKIIRIIRNKVPAGSLVCQWVCVCVCVCVWLQSPKPKSSPSVCLYACPYFSFFIPLSSSFFFFALTRYDILSLFLSFFWVWLTPKLILSANSWMIYSRKSLCLLWNCARFHLRLDLFFYSIQSGCFVFFFLTLYLPNWSILAYSSSLSILLFPLKLFFPPILWHLILHLTSFSCGYSSAACWREQIKQVPDTAPVYPSSVSVMLPKWTRLDLEETEAEISKPKQNQTKPGQVQTYFGY